MKESHPSTEKLLDRALDYLISTDLETGSIISLNDKVYKEINFSSQQIIDTMHELAIPGDVLFKNRSSIRNINGKPNIYKDKINKAKNKKIIRNTTKSGLIQSSRQKLTIAELTQEVMVLTEQNNYLRKNITSLSSFIEQAELEEKMESTKPMINTSPSSDEKYKLMLIQLIQYLYEDQLIVYDKARGRVAPSVIYERLNETTLKLCDLADLKEIADIETDRLGKISIKAKS